MLLRDRLIPTDIVFFTGIELTVVSIIILSFIISDVISKNLLPVVTASLAISYIIYLAYKINTLTSLKFINILYYGSFLPTFIYLLLQIL